MHVSFAFGIKYDTLTVKADGSGERPQLERPYTEDFMLKRKFYDRLVTWKNTKKQSCLLVKGARQIGKTLSLTCLDRKITRATFVSIL